MTMNAGTNFRRLAEKDAPRLTIASMNAKVASRLTGPAGWHMPWTPADRLTGLEPDLRRRQPPQQVDPRGSRKREATTINPSQTASPSSVAYQDFTVLCLFVLELCGTRLPTRPEPIHFRPGQSRSSASLPVHIDRSLRRAGMFLLFVMGFATSDPCGENIFTGQT